MRINILNMAYRFFVLFSVFYVGGGIAQSNLNEDEISLGNTWLGSAENLSAEDLTVAAMMEKTLRPNEENKYISEIVNNSDVGAVALSIAAYHCLSDDKFSFCENNKVFSHLLAIDSNNLEPYLYLVVRLYEQKEVRRSLSYLQRGLETKLHNDYYVDKLTILMDSLVKIGYSENTVYIQASAYADVVSWYSIYSRLHNICKTQSASNREWKYSCLFLGARLQNSSRSLIANVFGGAIQRDVLIATNADQGIIELISERREWDNKIRDLANEKMNLLNDPENYPETFKQDGIKIPEREAILRALYRTL